MPDLLVAGSCVAVPVIPNGVEPNPENGELLWSFSGPRYATVVFDAGELSFGLAIMHIFWALERITLGALPYGRVLHEAIVAKDQDAHRFQEPTAQAS